MAKKLVYLSKIYFIHAVRDWWFICSRGRLTSTRRSLPCRAWCSITFTLGEVLEVLEFNQVASIFMPLTIKSKSFQSRFLAALPLAELSGELAWAVVGGGMQGPVGAVRRLIWSDAEGGRWGPRLLCKPFSNSSTSLEERQPGIVKDRSSPLSKVIFMSREAISGSDWNC